MNYQEKLKKADDDFKQYVAKLFKGWRGTAKRIPGIVAYFYNKRTGRPYGNEKTFYTPKEMEQYREDLNFLHGHPLEDIGVKPIDNRFNTEK